MKNQPDTNKSKVEEINSSSNSEIAYADIIKHIKNRKKFGKLTTMQRNYLRKLLWQSNHSIKEISLKYFVSKSLLYSLKQGRECSSDNNTIKPDFSISTINEPTLKRFINDFVVKTEVPIKAKDVQEMIFKDYSIEIPIGRIILIMKEDLNLTYK